MSQGQEYVRYTLHEAVSKSRSDFPVCQAKVQTQIALTHSMPAGFKFEILDAAVLDPEMT